MSKQLEIATSPIEPCIYDIAFFVMQSKKHFLPSSCLQVDQLKTDKTELHVPIQRQLCQGAQVFLEFRSTICRVDFAVDETATSI